MICLRSFSLCCDIEEPEMVTVPNVVGMTQAQASNAIQNAGLSVHVINDWSEKVAKGNVISQSIAAGSKVASGTYVRLVVSQGVPNVPKR